jgi:hypothetical protein
VRRETFVAILSAILAEASDELISEAEGLVFWRKRELRAARVSAYTVGQTVAYRTATSERVRTGQIAKLNKYSVTIRIPSATEGYVAQVVPIERVIGPATPEEATHV